MAVRAENALEEGRAARSPDAGARHRRLGGWVEKEVAGDEERDVVGQWRHHRDHAALMEEGSTGRSRAERPLACWCCHGPSGCCWVEDCGAKPAGLAEHPAVMELGPGRWPGRFEGAGLQMLPLM